MYKLVDNDLFHYVPYYLMSNQRQMCKLDYESYDQMDKENERLE